jgi:tetratricopeptide (TPR) repeat protein
MWARTGVHVMTALLLAAAGAPLGGCQMSDWAPAGLFGELFAPRRRTVLVEMEDTAAFEEGVSLASQLKYAEAEQKFSTVLGWYEAAGDRPRAAETKFWLAFCQEKQGRTAEAKGLYSHILRKYRDTPAARQAAERLNRLPAP